MKTTFPTFQYNLQNPNSSNFGYITLGDEKVHYISDPKQFYEALGYTDARRYSGVLPEEFIWEAFFKDNREQCSLCLQLKIFGYVSKHSKIFRTIYAVDSLSLIENCMQKLSGNAECMVCKLSSNA